MIYLYNDRGVSKGSFHQAFSCLKKMAPKTYAQGHDIHPISAAEIRQGTWQNNAQCLVMPGGADVPYARALNGLGNQMIRSYVEQGGLYIGICAGAYYAARRIVFDQHGPLEVLADRELGFFPGSIVGPYWKPYVVGHHIGSTALRIHCTKAWSDSPWHAYINGGGTFILDDPEQSSDIIPVAWDDHENLIMVMIPVKKGWVFLSAAHWEYDPMLLNLCCKDKERGCWDEQDYAAWTASNATRALCVQNIMSDLFSRSFTRPI